MTGQIVIEGKELPIKNFKLQTMVSDPSIVMIAKRGSGKSWVTRSILKYLNKLRVPGGLIIAPTDKMNTFYGNFFPNLYIHYEYRSEILEGLLYRQELIIAKSKNKKKRNKKVDPRCFLVMDDCLSSKTTWIKDKPILDMFYNGRHFKVTFILTMQFPLGIGPELRSNFDYVFLLADDFISNQKRLYDHYAGMFPDFATFRDVFMQMTLNYGCMVIVNRGNRQGFLDKIFKYKAEYTSKSTIGSRQFIKFHKLNYDEEWNKKKSIISINELASRRKKTGREVKIHYED